MVEGSSLGVALCNTRFVLCVQASTTHALSANFPLINVWLDAVNTPAITVILLTSSGASTEPRCPFERVWGDDLPKLPIVPHTGGGTSSSPSA